MSGERTVMLGAGALARDVVLACPPGTFSAVFVDEGYEVQDTWGLPLLRRWDQVRTQATHYALGLLEAQARRRLRDAARAHGLHASPPYVMPTARIAPGARLGHGCQVGHNVDVGALATLGDDVLLMHNAVIGHDATLGENTVVLPGAWVGGYARVGADCFLGANSVTSPRLAIGDGCVLAPGAACLKDLEAGSLLIGNPGRARKLASG